MAGNLTGMAQKTVKNRTAPSYRRIVVKLGTRLLTGGKGDIDQEVVSRLVNQIARLHRQGVGITVVSSGAVALGRGKLGVTRRIRGIPFKQVMAAVGQNRLMAMYERLFKRHDMVVAQALLSRLDLCDRAGYLNARNTLMALLDLKVVCIVNENDTVAVDELQDTKFGDNDTLSAMVANLVDADLLVMLTDTDGLYTDDPRRCGDACLIPVVEKIDRSIEKLAAGSHDGPGTGGMITKVEAARMATSCGIRVVVANGNKPDIILKLAKGSDDGTHFLPAEAELGSRQRWMLSGLSTRGRLIVDEGAAAALKKQHRSLLAAGIREVQGKVRRGDIVNIFDAAGNLLGCGLVNYSADDITAIKGVHSGKIAGLLGYDYGSEVVHRNNLVVL